MHFQSFGECRICKLKNDIIDNNDNNNNPPVFLTLHSVDNYVIKQ